MGGIRPLLVSLIILTGCTVISSSDKCIYNSKAPSTYVQCLSITQRPPYACESNGGSRSDDNYQIHILETDLDRVSNYNETTPPEIVVVIKPLTTLDTTQTIVLVFHSFRQVVWRVYTELFPINTKFIIKSSYPLIIDPTSILSKTPVDLMYTLPKDSEGVIRTIESLYKQRVTSFSGFHEGSMIHWFIGPGDKDSICTILPFSITKRIQIYKEIPVPTSGCTVPNHFGYITHIIDIDKTHESEFPFAKHFAKLIVKSKSTNEQEFYGSNVVLILRSKTIIEWTIDTSGMDGNVLIVMNGKTETPNHSNLKVQSVVGGFPDKPPEDFINYVTKTYGMVASYTKAEMANHVIIEVPEVQITPNPGNTTEQPQTQPLPDLEEIVASVDGQKNINCYKNKVTVTWPMSLLDSLNVDNINFMGHPEDECSLQMLGSQMALFSGYEDCGLDVQEGMFSSVYTADFEISLMDGRKSQISVQCQIYNTTRINSEPKRNLYYLSIYDDADYTNHIEQFNVPNNGYVYFKADLKNITDPNMSAIVEECFLSPTQDNILDRHVLISHTCPLDSSIHFINQNYIGLREEKAQKIKFRMSQYFINSNDYYLHCKVSMCSKITTPDIPRCSMLYQMCRRNPPEQAGEELLSGFEDDYILAGPIFIRNNTGMPTEPPRNNSSVYHSCGGKEKDDKANVAGDKFVIGVGLLIGIALGSFAIGIILTVFIIHCVSISRKRCKHQPTDIFRFENRNETLGPIYEPIRLKENVYDVCPQGHHLNRTTQLSQPPGQQPA